MKEKLKGWGGGGADQDGMSNFIFTPHHHYFLFRSADAEWYFYCKFL